MSKPFPISFKTILPARSVSHLIFWAGYYLVIVFVLANRLQTALALWYGFLLISPQIIIAYINMQWLVPQYFMQKRFLHFAVSVIVLFTLLYFTYEAIGLNRPFLYSRADFREFRELKEFGGGQLWPQAWHSFWRQLSQASPFHQIGCKPHAYPRCVSTFNSL